MQALHHRAEVFADSQVAERVVVVVEQARDPGDEAELVGVVIEAIPEDCFCLSAREGWEAVAASGGDEVDLVVEVPMFVAVVTFV